MFFQQKLIFQIFQFLHFLQNTVLIINQIQVMDDLFLYFTGEKTYDRSGSDFSQGCTIEWKLYDSEGYLVKSSHFFTESMSVGDKFKDGKVSAYRCITPGETYTLIIANADSEDTD